MNPLRIVLSAAGLLLLWAPGVSGQVPPCPGCNPPDPPVVDQPPPFSQITNVITHPLIATVLHSTMASRSHRIAFVIDPPEFDAIGPYRLFVVEADGTGLVEVTAPRQFSVNAIVQLKLSGDGRMLAWIEGGFDDTSLIWVWNDIFVADLEQGTLRNLTEDLFFFPKKQIFHSMDMTDAGDLIYATRIADQFGSFGPPEFDMWRLATDGSKAEKIQQKFGKLAVSGDGETVAFSSYSSTFPEILILDADGEEQFSVALPVSGGTLKDIDYAGERLLFQGGPQCWTVDLQTLQITPQQVGSTAGQISGDGQWVYFQQVVAGSSFRDVYRARFDGGDALKLASGSTQPGDISFDGSLVAYNKKSSIVPSGGEVYVTDFRRPNLTVASPTSPGLPLLATVNGRAGQAFALLLSLPDVAGPGSSDARAGSSAPPALRVVQGTLDATGSFVLLGTIPADPALLGFTADLVALVGPPPLSRNADLTNTVRVVVE